MKSYTLLLIGTLGLAACSGNPTGANSGAEQQPRTAVTLTHAAYGSIRQEITLSATTVYQDKSAVTAPIAAFITEARVQSGTRVRAGQLLYSLESKEQHALGSKDGNSLIPIRAAHDGIVLDVLQQAGSYVTEGTLLCTMAESGSLVFEINVPYEQRKKVRSGKAFTLELPDGTRLPATVQLPLATMNTASQAERVVASAPSVPFLPEGLNVKALFAEDAAEGKSMLLPKAAVQSDETLTEHWVMKLSADSTAVKVPVTVTGSTTTEVAVCSEALSPQDAIILTGGYGLETGARVTVVREGGSHE